MSIILNETHEYCTCSPAAARRPVSPVMELTGRPRRPPPVVRPNGAQVEMSAMVDGYARERDPAARWMREATRPQAGALLGERRPDGQCRHDRDVPRRRFSNGPGSIRHLRRWNLMD